MYLLAQIWWLLLVAFLLGVLVGYLVWRACGVPRVKSTARRERLNLEDQSRLLRLENARLEEALTEAAKSVRRAETERLAPSKAPMPTAPSSSPVATVPSSASPRAMNGPDARPMNGNAALHPMPPMPMPPNGNGSLPPPAASSALRNGKADNLRLIRGVGPRLEKILNSMGVFHFEQIANWTDKDLAIIDSHLGDFAGRAVRDKWIDQSRKLAGLDGPPVKS